MSHPTDTRSIPTGQAAAPQTSPQPTRKKGRVLRCIGRALAVFVLTLAIAWSAAALWIDGPSARWLAGTLAAAAPIACIAAFWRVRRFWRSYAISAGVFVVVLLWWLSIPPSNSRDWQPDVARLSTVEFSGSKATIHNVRNFLYRSETDFTPRWETRIYDLDQVVGLDLFLSYWGPTLIAHTIVSFEFADGQHLAVSIETRKEQGESYSALLGFFRQFEVYYVVADEQDLIGVRASHRGETVYLYRIRSQPGKPEAILKQYLSVINGLAKQPEWYNALTENCTTTIRSNLAAVGAARSPHWKMLLNGYLDELMYDRSIINTNVAFPDMKKRSDITERAKAAAGDPDFSRRIREGLPERS